MCSVFSCIAGGLKFPLFWLLHSHRYTLIFIMAKVPLALDTGALAALLNVQDANVVTMVPALAQPAVQVPQAANADQPAEKMRTSLFNSKPTMLDKLQRFAFVFSILRLYLGRLLYVSCPVSVVRSLLVHFVLSVFFFAIFLRVVCIGVFGFFSFLLFVWVAGICSSLVAKLVTHLVPCYCAHCRPLLRMLLFFYSYSSCKLELFALAWFPSSPREFSTLSSFLYYCSHQIQIAHITHQLGSCFWYYFNNQQAYFEFHCTYRQISSIGSVCHGSGLCLYCRSCYVHVTGLG